MATVNITTTKSLVPMGMRRDVGRRMARTIRDIIYERTLDGVFGPGTDKETYNIDYARKKGKPFYPVTLRDTGSMLDQMKGIYKFSNEADTILAAIRFQTSRAEFLADIHNRRGAGRGQIRRRFLYLRPRDESRIMSGVAEVIAN
jgi:hypothetical protein